MPLFFIEIAAMTKNKRAILLALRGISNPKTSLGKFPSYLMLYLT